MAKTRLLEKRMSLVDLARNLGLHRNSVSIAINRGEFPPTKSKIAKFLGISEPNAGEQTPRKTIN